MTPMQSVFSDGASLIVREMLAHPDKKWVVRDFVNDHDLGHGWAAKVLKILRAKGYVKGEARGRRAGAVLRSADELLQAWVRHYTIESCVNHVYYSPDQKLLSKLKKYFEGKGDSYALTLHTGANLLTNYVRDPNLYLYLKAEDFEKISLGLRLALDLKELKNGGNVHLISPYYKRTAFHGARKIKGYTVVSNLQLYLDLFNFPQRGREHAEYLAKILKKEGDALA